MTQHPLADALRRIQDEANTVCGDWRETASLIDSICIEALSQYEKSDTDGVTIPLPKTEWEAECMIAAIRGCYPTAGANGNDVEAMREEREQLARHPKINSAIQNAFADGTLQINNYGLCELPDGMKSDTDRDQLREALETLDRVIQFGLMPEGLYPDQADRALERVRAALASKTAIDPVPDVQSVVGKIGLRLRQSGLLSDQRLAEDLETAIRALGKDQ